MPLLRRRRRSERTRRAVRAARSVLRVLGGAIRQGTCARLITSLVLLLVTLHATRCFACLCVAFLPPIVPQEVINTFTLCSHAVARYAMPMQLIVVRDPGGRPMRRISRFRSRSGSLFCANECCT